MERERRRESAGRRGVEGEGWKVKDGEITGEGCRERCRGGVKGWIEGRDRKKTNAGKGN